MSTSVSDLPIANPEPSPRDACRSQPKHSAGYAKTRGFTTSQLKNRVRMLDRALSDCVDDCNQVQLRLDSAHRLLSASVPKRRCLEREIARITKELKLASELNASFKSQLAAAGSREAAL